MVSEWQKFILVLLGGACGTGCRYGLSSMMYSLTGRPNFPYANFVINISGSLLIGFLAELFESRGPVSPAMRTAILTGVLGGYTTFSSFAFETLGLLRSGKLDLALLNAAGSLVLGLVAVWAGVRLAQTLS